MEKNKKELIKIESGYTFLDDVTNRQLADFERAIKKLKEREDKLKAALLSEMEAKGIVKLDTGELTISYIAPTDRETFDSKALKEADPDTYDNYVRMTPVKASVRIKVK